VAVKEKAQAQPTKATVHEPAAGRAPAPKAAAPTAGPTMRLPSPPVAAAILAGASRTAPAHPRTKPPPPVVAPSTRVAPARVVPLAPPAAPATRQPGGGPAPAPHPATATRPADRKQVAPASPASGKSREESVAPTKRGGGPAAPAPQPAAPGTKVSEAEPATATAPPAQAGAESPSAQPEAVEPAAPEKKEAPSGAKTEGPKAGEKPEGKSAAAEGKAEGKEAPAAPGGGKRPSAGGGPVRLRMPEPPSAPSAATMGRIRKVQARAGAAAGAQAELPAGAEQVGEARQAVTEPDAEATAKAQADLITALGEQPKPSPEIEKLCERIKQVIRDKRPPDQDALEEADPEAAASDAGNQLNSSVQGDTQRVQGSYDSIQESPTGAAPAKGEELPGQPPAAGTAPVNAQAATPDAIPDKNVSLDADAADSKQKMQDAGMDSESAKLVQSGPVAEARDAQGELEKTAKEDPAKVLAGQQQALGKAEANMAELQQQALASLTASRAGAVKSTTQRQHGMVGSEESTRTRASEEAKQIFTQTQSQVTSLLQPLAQNAMQEWDAAKDVLVSKFKTDLADVKRRVDERHSGVTGWAVGVWDAVTGLPSWAERDYSRAERNFGDGVCDRMKQISVKVNTVIATCDALIKSARERIAKIFADLPAGLREWAAGEQAKFDGQLNKLHDQAMAARDGFNKDLVKNASQAVQEVREEVAELRKKAGGLLGRIADAVNRFLEDPAKFIIEGLLELVGIPPASFWALIAKIKKVIKDIADDPLKFANNLMAGLGKGFGQFFDNIGTHLLKGFLNWLLGGLGDAGVQIPKDLSLKSIITFLLQLMGITWPRIRKILAKHLGEKNVALAEKVYSLVSLLIEKGPEGIYEMIKEKLDPQSLVDQVVQMAVDYMITAIMKAAAVRIALLFNPAGAIFQALEAIYRVLKWIFENAARIFTLVETVVNGIADIIAGNLGGFANAIEKGLGMLIAPVIGFIADYLGFGDLPGTIASKVKSFQQWILGLIEQALVWLIEKGKALLAAVGLGKKEKKEKDKDGGAVGEDLSWTVRGESHRMWIAEEAGNYVPMVASEKPHPVRVALRSYTQQVKKLDETDEDAATRARAAIGTAGKSLDDIERALSKYEKAAKAQASKEELASLDTEVEGHEEALKDAVAEIQDLLGFDDDERIKKVKKEFEGSPFSTTDDLAPFLDIVPRTAQKVVQKWIEKGVVFRIQSATTDPGGINTFDPSKAEWREVDANNRQKYGYVNPKKTSQTGLTILSKGLLGSTEGKGKLKRATAADKRSVSYHTDLAHYRSTRDPGGYPDFMFEDAILGHGKPGASEHWNQQGHKWPRDKNYEWNQDPDNYNGPEHKTESAASGAESDRYELPTKARRSHQSWWK
jgi:hypothetical protein